jgi:hypothetical protein
MTKTERLAVQIQRNKQALAQRQARLREVTRQATNKRRYQVGALADDAGLLAWSNADLAGLFTALATLKDVPNPVAVLEAILGDSQRCTVGCETGVAETPSRVSAAH